MVIASTNPRKKKIVRLFIFQLEVEIKNKIRRAATTLNWILVFHWSGELKIALWD